MQILRIQECKSWKDATDSQIQHFKLARTDRTVRRDPLFHKVPSSHIVKKKFYFQLSILVNSRRKALFAATMSLEPLSNIFSFLVFYCVFLEKEGKARD